MITKDPEELLEFLWKLQEESTTGTVVNLKNRLPNPESFEEQLQKLIEEQLISRQGDQLALTASGKKRACTLIRCHRLAERLLHDVLDLEAGPRDYQACLFEHVLTPEVEESICILLGHPAVCPDGKSIPQGECCKKERQPTHPIIIPLTKVPVGSNAKVVYIASNKHSQIDRLSPFGIIPGNTIRLHQTHPSYVIVIGETQLAIDDQVAACINVKLL